MITLAIETSCDETAICLLETRGGQNGLGGKDLKYRILANVIHSQIDLHKQYGGVFPIMAKREHARNSIPLLETALREAKIKMDQTDAAESAGKIEEVKKILQEKEYDLLENVLASSLVKEKPVSGSINRIAVTQGPGLEPALWVGVNLAKALGILWDIPVVGVNHMEGHVVGSFLPSSDVWNGVGGSASDFKKLIPVTYPALALLISGGHTEIVLVNVDDKNMDAKNPVHSYIYGIVGRTKDDAVGEAFDKTARMLGLPYPGGPEISKLAAIARSENTQSAEKKINLPRPMLHSHDLDFSFSGLKTAVLYLIRELTKNGAPLTDDQKKEIAREFEDAVTDVLVSKTEKAIEKYGVQTLIAGGGVIANKHITERLKILAEKHSLPLLLPPTGVSGDNALMIALAGVFSDPNPNLPENSANIKAQGNLSL